MRNFFNRLSLLLVLNSPGQSWLIKRRLNLWGSDNSRLFSAAFATWGYLGICVLCGFDVFLNSGVEVLLLNDTVGSLYLDWFRLVEVLLCVGWRLLGLDLDGMGDLFADWGWGGSYLWDLMDLRTWMDSLCFLSLLVSLLRFYFLDWNWFLIDWFQVLESWIVCHLRGYQSWHWVRFLIVSQNLWQIIDCVDNSMNVLPLTEFVRVVKLKISENHCQNEIWVSRSA